ncbi:uncharacterized protein A4U43_C06F2610 [Asparagus officinalis]|uniref:Uncharacterized protein n=1 Tax=Asparagus officinalis TaxID=4686 RepID=A0A5P1EJ67_ASPOF|nr:uncharacterized protein A4U43_C06F2610 [Asparagus officinalis]
MLVLDNLEAVGGVGSENSMPQRVVPRHAASDEDDAEGDDEVGEDDPGFGVGDEDLPDGQPEKELLLGQAPDPLQAAEGEVGVDLLIEPDGAPVVLGDAGAVEVDGEEGGGGVEGEERTFWEEAGGRPCEREERVDGVVEKAREEREGGEREEGLAIWGGGVDRRGN